MDDELLAAPVRFQIFTREFDAEAKAFKPSWLKAAIGSDGKMRLSGIASSTIKDLHGDTMLASALEDMENAANSNLTIFGNHSYDVPEDVYGSVERAIMKQAGTVDAAGDPIYDLTFDIIVNKGNERAVKAFNAIHEDGIKLGLSIGAMIPEGGATRNKKSGALTISHVDLLETSIVGIPANPRSWVQNAVKGFGDLRKASRAVPIGSPTLSLDAENGTYTIEGSISDIGSGVGLSAGVGEIDVDDDAVLMSTHEKCGTTIQGGFPEGLCTTCGETGPFLMTYLRGADVPAEAEVTPEVLEGTCPDCHHGKGDGGSCSNPYHKDVEPEVTDAKITVIEVDTGPAAESSPESDPPADEEEPVGGDMTDAAKAVVVEAQAALGDLEDAVVVTAVNQLIALSEGLLEELTRSKEAERRARSEAKVAITAAGDLISQTNALVQRLGDLRVGPKAVVREVADGLDDLQGVYSKAFMDMLKSKG